MIVEENKTHQLANNIQTVQAIKDHLAGVRDLLPQA